MKPSTAVDAHRQAIREIVSANRASNRRVFGSVVHCEADEGSDLELFVDSTSETSLFDLAGSEAELEALLGVKVEVLTPGFLPDSFRLKVIAEAEPV